MKEIIIFFIIFMFLFSTTPVYAEWVDYDKTLHISAGMITYSAGEFLEIENPMKLVIIAGAGKEIYDHFSGTGTVQLDDIIATVSGGMIASYLLNIEIKF